MRRIADTLRTDEEECLAADHIQAECERIQAGWLAHEWAKRQVTGNERVLFREVPTSVLVAGRRQA